MVVGHLLEVFMPCALSEKVKGKYIVLSGVQKLVVGAEPSMGHL